MTLLAPFWLFAAAVGAIVILLHATRRRDVAVASLQLWLLLGAGATRRTVRRRPPLTASLLLQLLAVLLVAFALAQPRLGNADAEHIVFVVDGSGSMRTNDVRGTSRFAAAQADVIAAIRAVAADGDVRVSVVRAASDPVLVAVHQTRPAGIVPLVEELRPGDGAVDWPATLARLAPLLAGDERSRVVVLTDDVAAATAAAAALPPATIVDHVRYGRPDTPNAAIAARLVAVDAAAGRWRVEGTIALSGGAEPPVAVALSFAPGAVGELLDWQALAVRRPPASITTAPANEPQTVAFGGELSLPGAGRLKVALPADAAPHDDAAFFTVFGAPRPLRVVFVGPAEPNLVRAIEAVGPAEIRISERVPVDVTDVDLVVVATTIERRPATNVLWLGEGRLAGAPTPTLLATADPTFWDPTHPLSRNVDWAALEGPPAHRAESLPGAATIVAAGDLPVVSARSTAFGRDIRLALDLAPGGFADAPTFPAFVANLIDWLGPEFGRETGVPCVAGAPCRLAARDVAARIIAPDGSIALPGTSAEGPLPRGYDATFAPLAAGFYTATRADGATTPIAVNPAAETVAATGAAGGALPPGPFRLAPWLLAAAFLALLAEAIVAGRGAERFLRRASVRVGAPGATRRRGILALRVAALGAILAAILAVPLPAREPGATVFAITTPATTDPAAGFAAEASRRDAASGVTVVSAAAGPTGVDLAGAVRLAAAMLPADRAGRIVIAADGNETLGRLGAALPGAMARDIPIDTEARATMPPGEVLVARVEAGRHVRAGNSVPLTALLYAASPASGAIEILRDGAVVATETVALTAGWNRLDTVVPAVAARTLVEIAVTAEGDVEPGNNRDGVLILPGVAPRVLVVSPDREWAALFAAAIEAQGLAPEVITPDRAPRDLAGWLAHDVVVLMNVPALALTTTQQELLDDAVGRHGRGLLILGGENAFGPGGYYATALERLSPLSSRVPQEAPRAAIVFVVDRSGSMQAPVDDVTRLDIAREATLGAVGLLPAESEVGIVVFDSEAQVIVPMQPAEDQATIAAALAPLAPGGGTELFPALTAALGILRDSTAETKHMVVITDGLVEPVDFTGLMAEIVAAGITVSTVAVGTSAITDKLERIAADGGGAYHATADFKALPGILAEEAMYLATSPVMIGARPVDIVDHGADFLAGLSLALPPVEAFVATTAKDEADLHLATIDNSGAPMPLLASWRYGVGRVLALATHGAGPGTLRWLEAPEYALLWAQAVRAFVPAAAGPGLHATLVRDGDAVRIEALLIDDRGAPVEDATVTAAIDGGSPVPLTYEEAGRYAGFFVAASGAHEVAFTEGERVATAAVHIGYPARLDFTRSDPTGLAASAAVTGGRAVDAVAALDVARVWTMRAAWRPWLVLALVLLLADLALRQAIWPQRQRRSLGRPFLSAEVTPGLPRTPGPGKREGRGRAAPFP